MLALRTQYLPKFCEKNHKRIIHWTFWLLLRKGKTASSSSSSDEEEDILEEKSEEIRFDAEMKESIRKKLMKKSLDKPIQSHQEKDTSSKETRRSEFWD